MRELYIILGRIGWIWLGVVLVLLVVALLVERYRHRRSHDARLQHQERNGVRGFEVMARDEKQS